MEIDVNCDLGEGCGLDAELLALITSANVCCGLHAGDAQVSYQTLALAARLGVCIGAHPGSADREHFGRRELALSADQVFCLCLFQIGGLARLADELGAKISYVKPHGALYNQACRLPDYARAVCAAAGGLPVVGLPGSELARAAGAAFVAEGFADRRYLPDGTLVPRSRPDAFIHDPDEAVRQVDWLVRNQGVRTICVHGDNPQAVVFVRALRGALLSQGFCLKAFV